MLAPQVLAPQGRMSKTREGRVRLPGILLLIIVMVAILAVLASRDPAAVAPSSPHTNASPTAQVVWAG